MRTLVTIDATKSIAGNAWDAEVRSEESYTGGARALATVPSSPSTKQAMFGLNADPTTNTSYTSLDYALYNDLGTLRAYEGGALAQTFGTVAAGDRLEVLYDNVSIIYKQNGTTLRTVATTGGRTFSFDSSFYTASAAKWDNLHFEPYPSAIVQPRFTATNATLSAIVSERATAQAASLGIYSKVEITDPDGTWKDVSALLGVDFFNRAQLTEELDASAQRFSMSVLREVGTLSLVPLMTGSTVNRNAAAAYAPMLDLRRKWRVSVAVVGVDFIPRGGMLTRPDASYFREIGYGYIDRIDVSDTGTEITVTGRDLGALVLDSFIFTERSYGSVGGEPMESVIQQMLDDNADDNGLPAITLYTPVSPGFLMNVWTQPTGNLMQAINAVAAKKGFVVRYRYDAAHVLRLTLYQPNRAAAPGQEVFTLGPTEYLNIPLNSLDISGVRTFVKTKFWDAATQTIQTVTSPSGSGAAPNIVSEDFEDGTVTLPLTQYGTTVVADPTPGGSGNMVAKQAYSTAGPGADDNRAVELPHKVGLATGLPRRIAFQGDFYVDSTLSGGWDTSSAFRKFLYWKSFYDYVKYPNGPGGVSSRLVLQQKKVGGIQKLHLDYTHNPAAGRTIHPHTLATGTGSSPVPNQLTSDDVRVNIDLFDNLIIDTWYTVNFDFTVETALGAGDGTLKIQFAERGQPLVTLLDIDDVFLTDPDWVGADGDYSSTWNAGGGISMLADDVAMFSYLVGEQLQGTAAITEDRYWDNVQFSTAAIGGGPTSPAIEQYGYLPMEIDLSAEDPINSSAKAQTFTDIVRSDVETPALEQQIESFGLWWAQLGDYVKTEPNGKHYDTPQYGAVTAIVHTIANGTMRTVLNLRGKPAGRYRTWTAQGAGGGVIAPPVPAVRPPRAIAYPPTTEADNTTRQYRFDVELGSGGGGANLFWAIYEKIANADEIIFDSGDHGDLPQTIVFARHPKHDKVYRYYVLDQATGRSDTVGFIIPSQGAYIDETGLQLTDGVTQQQALAARALMKGYQVGLCRDGDVVAFDPVYQNPPAIRFFGGKQPNASFPYHDDAAVGHSASGFTARLKNKAKGTIVARDDEFTSPLTTTTSGGTVGPATLGDAPSSDNNYTVRFRVNVKCTTLLADPVGSVLVGVAIESNAASGGGGSWVERAFAMYSASRTSHGTTTEDYPAQQRVINVAGLDNTDQIRLKLKFIAYQGGAQPDTQTLEGYDYSPTGEGHGITYATATGGSTESKTPDADDFVMWEAWEVAQ